MDLPHNVRRLNHRMLLVEDEITHGLPVLAHAASHGNAGDDPLSGILESQLTLNFATHSNANDPSSDEKDALDSGSSPSSINPFATISVVAAAVSGAIYEGDPRLDNARTPTSHASSHVALSTDPLSGILESQLTLNFATHANTNDPSSGEKAALAGTSGTPGSGNKYVTDGDARNSNARTPSSHVLATGTALGGEHTISGANAGEVLRALSATTAAFDVLQYTDLGSVPSTFAPSAHAASHAHGGSDALSGTTDISATNGALAIGGTLTGPSGASFQVRGAASRALVLGAGAADLLTLATTGNLSWASGLGAITHISGPSDQPLAILAAASRALSLGGNNATLLTLTSAGAAGIGTASPQALLEISSTTAAQLMVRHPTETADNVASLVFLTGTGARADTNTLAAIEAIITQGDPSSLKSKLVFRVNAGDNETPYMALLSDGLLQIGASVNSEGSDVGQLGVFGTDLTVGAGAAILSVQSSSAAAINKGGSIGLGARCTDSDSTGTHLAMISGRKENSSSGDSDGFLEFGVRSNSGGMNVRGICSSGGDWGFGIVGALSGRVHVKGASNVTALYVEKNGSPTNAFDTNAGAGTPARLTNAGAWTNASCWKEYKQDFENIDPQEFLERIGQSEIYTFRHIEDVKGQGEKARRCLSVMQDSLCSLFGLPDDGISPQEIASIALVGIKGLLERIRVLEDKIAA